MNIYDTQALIQVVPNLKLAQQFLLTTFFPNVITEESEYVSIDVEVGKRRMAPFCSPLVEGKVVESRRVATNTFKPPYIKDKRAPDLRRPIRRQIGERIGGELSPAQREAASIQYEMEDQVDMLNRRLEWMAARVLSTGQLTVSGEGFPTTLIDFGRDAALTVTLSGGARWGQSGVSPADSIDDWQQTILQKSGAKVKDIVFTKTPWKHFKADDKVKGAVFYPALASLGNVINPGAKIERGAVYMGQWGEYSLWVYNDWYVDPADNTEYPMLADGTVIMSGPDMMGTRAFATILDPSFNYTSMAFAPKTWVENDPPQRFLMMQSSPLVIPSRVNASLGATVI